MPIDVPYVSHHFCRFSSVIEPSTTICHNVRISFGNPCHHDSDGKQREVATWELSGWFPVKISWYPHFTTMFVEIPMVTSQSLFRRLQTTIFFTWNHHPNHHFCGYKTHDSPPGFSLRDTWTSWLSRTLHVHAGADALWPGNGGIYHENQALKALKLGRVG